MNNTNDKEDNNQTDVKESEKMKTIGKIHLKQSNEILKDSSKNTNDNVQRAIEGLKEIPDEELQEFLDDDFMEGLDVVDAWEGDEERNRENERDKKNAMERKERRSSRERHHPEPKESHNRVKPKREERKREEIRRDPLKSTKDIERDKIRTKRDTENKLLAEKEKAIKHLLDSDNVVPPGTEAEAIQSITDEQNRERAQREAQRKEHRRSKSFDRYSRSSPIRRRTPDRFRPSPHRRRSPFIVSPERRRSPFKTSAERHRSPHRYSPNRRKNSPRYFSDRRSPIMLSPDRRRSPRRLSGERRSSVDRRWSAERSRRRRAERRRSRSHDRRSRSMERQRRRSSRSPASRRYSPRHRSRTRTRSRSIEKRTRKRSPFINELARQLRNEAMMPASVNTGVYVPPAIEGIAPLLNPPVYQQEVESRPPLPPTSSVTSSTYMHQSGQLTPSLQPTSVLPIPNGPPFMNFEHMPSIPPMNFESMPPPPPPPSHMLSSSGPIIYNQSNIVPSIQAPLPPTAICPSLLSAPVPSPQPVPAPVMDLTQIPYNSSHTMPSVQQSPICQFESSNNHSTVSSTTSQNYAEHRSEISYTEFHVLHEERMKTPEPPVISKPKQFEKTSLSSLLEASVSAKDPSNIPVLYPGFKPEIMRHCEQALCQLPFEDPRLKMKGRFFYDRNEEDYTKNDAEDHTSNSILLQKGKTKIFWEEINVEQQIIPIPKSTMQMHQKICQTEELEKETKSVQVYVTTNDVQTQVYPYNLQRPIMDRLDWNAREMYEYAPKFSAVEDLRWSLNNSSQRRSWNRQTSPSRRSADELEHHINSMEHGPRSLRVEESPVRSRDDFSVHNNVRDHYNRYSPDYHRRSMERDNFHDKRSDHSRGESPMELEESDNELVNDHTFQREHDWHGKGKISKNKSHILRGKHLGGRPYRSRGNFRGKF